MKGGAVSPTATLQPVPVQTRPTRRRGAIGYEELEALAPFDVVINATSASLRRERPPIPPVVFAGAVFAYKLAYGLGLTPFLASARNAGVTRLADGVGMLVEQAAEAFAWWRGVRPETHPVIDRLTIPLS